MTQQRNTYGNTPLEEEESQLETLIANGRASTVELARYQEIQRIMARAELGTVTSGTPEYDESTRLAKSQAFWRWMQQPHPFRESV